jgi:hypothetical protein
MKKMILAAILALSCFTIASAELFEGVDYYIDYKQKPSGYADTLHVNFVSLMPSPSAAAEVLRRQLAVYGGKHKKNIVGTAWHTVTGSDQDLKKIKFADDLGAYVWMSGSKKVVPFPTYVQTLKRRGKSR